MSLVEREKAWTKALLYVATPQLGKDIRRAWWREAKPGPKPCCAVQPRDSARTQADPGGKRQSVDRSLILRWELAIRRGDTLSLVERDKTWTQPMSCSASPRLAEETR